MITYNDQLELFRLVGTMVKKNISCYAFGGTAMMFYGYKDETKDVDIVFEEEVSRKEFIGALERLGFTETSPFTVNIPEKLRDKHRPLMFKRGEMRFDVFVKKIFRTELSPRMKEDVFAVHDFKEKHIIKVKVVRKEQIVLLKAVTDRQNDFDDIRTIVSRDKNFDWQYLIDEVIWQYQHGDSWVLLDMERTLLELKKYVFIEEKYLRQLYAAKISQDKQKKGKKVPNG